MEGNIIIEGRFDGEEFIPDEPLPTSVGSARLIITPDVPQPQRPLMMDIIGKGTLTQEEIDERMREIREGWGEP